MKTMLMRAGSIQVHQLNLSSGSVSPSRRLNQNPSPRVSLCRSISDPNMVRSGLNCLRLSQEGSVSYPDMSMIAEEDEIEIEFGGIGIGSGKGNQFGRDRNGGSDWKRGSGIGEYYQQMLKLNPANPLLLGNYANYLHQVEKNMERAEEYYGRAILASPGDGQLLSSYGKFIWETEKDEDRAQSYFDQALHSSPRDCTVLGSYAHFLWETDEDEEFAQEPAAAPAVV